MKCEKADFIKTNPIQPVGHMSSMPLTYADHLPRERPATIRRMADTRDALIRFMEDFELSDSKVAVVAECDPMTVYRWRSGRTASPKRSIIENVMRYYGAEPADYGLATPDAKPPPWFQAWSDQQSALLAEIRDQQAAILKKLYS